MRQFSLWLFVVVQIFLGQKFTIAQIVTPSVIQLTPLMEREICPRDLVSQIDAIINRPQYSRSHWGILLQPVDSPTPLYSLNAEKNFVPASNVKLLIAAAALLKLTPDYRFRTSIYRHNKTITVVGRGDPTLTTSQLETLVEQLKEQGIKKINHLIIDASYFPETSLNPSWEWSDLYTSYGVAASSFNLNENYVTLTLVPQKLGQPVKLIWSDPLAGKQWQLENQSLTVAKDTNSKINITGNFTNNILKIQGQLPINYEGDRWEIAIPNLNQYFLDSLVAILLKQGIKVNKVSLSNEINQNLGKEIAAIESEKLSIVITKMNQDSNNLYAETLLKSLGKIANSDDPIKVVQQTLKEIGINPEKYHLTDSSGLSRQNLVSPEVIGKTLTLMLSTPVGVIYRESLAKAGINGTLKNRFANTPLVDMLTGKTGTLTGVSALSGYLESPEFPPLVFSIIVNQSDQSGKDLRQVIDEIMLLTHNFWKNYSSQSNENREKCYSKRSGYNQAIE